MAEPSIVEPPYFRIYGDYAGPGPIFYTRDECPWLLDMEQHADVVRAEYQAYTEAGRNTLTASYVPDDVPIHGWRSINFVTYRHWYRRNCARFPRTVAFLRTIPYLTSAFVNLLEPGASLPAHNGDTNATYRCHLGLIVPSESVDACGLAVGGERTAWREGHAFAFNEAFSHFVWNRTDRDRVIMVVDVMRPAYRPRGIALCGDVLAAMALTGLETAVPPLRRLSARPRRLLHRALGLAARGVITVRDRAAAWDRIGLGPASK
jgi:aspartyl/asparaginyl beta-hydroxylase (cupin superfamily)